MPEKIFGGRYKVQDKIGIGGMATVYRGIDTVLGRTVAIKTMLPQYAADPSFAARFKQEAQAAAALQSPYIVGVYDWGKDNDTYYIIMEYLRGTDLKSGIRKHGALDPRKVAQIGSQICQALSVAHKHGIIHRDIKPQNIMVQPDGNIKVMDFGIARAQNSHLTQDNNVLGTAHYVSPEQTQGKDLQPTSDLYSLGIVMYEAATGKVPFEGEDAISVALKQVKEQPVAPSKINANVDSSLENIILKCMRKNPEERYQSADELRRVLNQYLAGHIIANDDETQAMPAAAVMPLKATDKGSTATFARVQDTSQDKKKSHRTRNIILGILAGLLVLGLLVFLFTNILGSKKAVPNFYGLTKEEALTQIQESNFFKEGSITENYSDTVEAGKVIEQTPSAGQLSERDTVIDLVISKGKAPQKEVKVPNLRGLTPSEAEQALEKVGLVGQAGDSIVSDVEAGKVAAQSVSAGSVAHEGDKVIYQLSKGKETVSVPNVVGQSKDAAIAALNRAGFSVSVIQENSDSVSKGNVVRQSLSGKQEKGTSITLTISLGPKDSTADNTNNSNQSSNNNTTNNQTPSTGSGTTTPSTGSTSATTPTPR